jgi:hypothetical protein
VAVRTGSYDILRQVTPEPSRSSKRVCIGSSRPFFDPPSRLCHGSVRVMRRRTEPANHAARCSSIRKGMTSAFGALESPATMAHLSLPKSGGPVKYFPSDVDRFRPQFDGKHPKAEVGAPEPRPAVELPILPDIASREGLHSRPASSQQPSSPIACALRQPARSRRVPACAVCVVTTSRHPHPARSRFPFGGARSIL